VEDTAIYELPVPIWVSTASLGERIPTGFGSVKFDVIMPLPGGPVGIAPALDGVVVPNQKPGSADLLVWVQRFAAFTPGDHTESTGLCRVVVQTTTAGLSASNYDLIRAIDPWFDAVRTWVETQTGQDLDPKHRVYDATTHGAGLTYIHPAPTGDGPIGLTLTTPRINPVPATTWRQILTAVAAGEEPPLEEQLCRDSRAAFARGQLRRSVIDAASAAEIVLHRIISAQVSPDDLSGRQARQKLQSLDKQPLGGLVTLASDAHLDLGVELDDLEGLSKVRNEAIHRGVSPESWSALQMVQAAIDLVIAHRP
jgi:hypothetical protein